MFCTVCGTRFTEDAAFCYECGSRIHIKSGADVPNTVSEVSAEDSIPAVHSSAPATTAMPIAPTFEYAQWPSQQYAPPVPFNPQLTPQNRRPWLKGVIISGAAIIILGIALFLILSSRIGGIYQRESAISIRDTLDKGAAYLVEGRFDLALEQFQLAIDADSNEADAYIGAADSYIGLGRIDRAVRVLEKGANLTGSRLIRSRLSQELDALERPYTTGSDTVEADDSEASPEPANTLPGNTNGNYLNAAIAAIAGEWIYFTRTDGIYKINTDGTGETLLIDDSSVNLSVAGGWIYYINTDLHHIYRIRTDGTDKTLVSDCFCSNYVLFGEWIYYSNFDKYMGQSLDEPYGIYKISLDGLDKELLIELYAQNLCSDGERVYFSIEGETPARVRIDGTDFEIVGDGTFRSCVVEDDWIYYTDTYNSINRMRTDGSDYSQIYFDVPLDLQLASLNVSEDWLYVSSFLFDEDTSGIYRIRIDGSETIRIHDENAMLLNIVGEWVYFLDILDNAFYRVRTNGSDLQFVDSLER
ncbi:MAG: DUF5050 domain-containing protein [Oscillospiraceae bacterium]|nr:DUF5050 domain-containing protein [Oscillospiraceae bacterium]